MYECMYDVCMYILSAIYHRGDSYACIHDIACMLVRVNVVAVAVANVS
jgi:hypothetical protein